MDDKFYQEQLIEHFKYPENKKSITHPDFSSGEYNPSCGDKVNIEGIIKNNKITDIGFSGSGCVVSQGTTSMLLEEVMGKTIDEILKLSKDDIIGLIGITLGPTRLKCALLSLQVLHQALLDYKIKNT